MLADECPRSTCYGIPLVRPPRAGRDREPPKVCSCSVTTKETNLSQQECVVCGTVYVTETAKKTQGLDPLVLGTLSGSRREEITTSSVSVEGSNPAAKGKEKASESPAMPAVGHI